LADFENVLFTTFRLRLACEPVAFKNRMATAVEVLELLMGLSVVPTRLPLLAYTLGKAKMKGLFAE
jgi:hypothetical protein